MKTITEEIIRVSAVITAGLILYGIAVVADTKGSTRPTQLATIDSSPQTLSKKKACILKSWADPELISIYNECAKYTAKGRVKQTQLASTKH